jgi:ribosome-associated protein
MTSETTAKKDIQKLQRAIVDGLEDVKGQDIVVFNTETLSPLFERVIIASGTSNRQTKALASSVRDAVREAGFDKPRIEGEDNGEWIIVDCGQAVAHVMQPVIRQYYRLEEIWGQKPVRLKHGAEKPAAAPARKAAPKKKSAEKAVAPVSGKTVVRKTAKSAAPAGATVSRGAAPKSAVKGLSKAVSKAPAKSAAGKTSAKTVKSSAKPKAALPKLIVNKPKPAAKSAAAKPVGAKAAPAKKAAPKKKA